MGIPHVFIGYDNQYTADRWPSSAFCQEIATYANSLVTEMYVLVGSSSQTMFKESTVFSFETQIPTQLSSLLKAS